MTMSLGCCRRSALAVSLCFLVAACGSFHRQTPDEQDVFATDEAFYQASTTTGAAAWKEYAAEDVNLSFARGRDAVEKAYAPLYARPGFSLVWHPATAEVVGDIAVTSGPYESHRRDDKGADTASTGRYVTIWKRQADGTWRFVWDDGTEDKK